MLTEKERQGKVVIDLRVAEQSIQRKALRYDKLGDQHYDHASAFIKSMRASDADAALYWLARMLEAGEDPRFIARRMAIFASEDVGNADPRALAITSAAWDLVSRLGMPEGKLTLAQTAIFLASAPKSRASTVAIGRAVTDVTQDASLPVPRKLRDAHYTGSQRLGHGPTAEDEEAADYFGVEATYYEPSDQGEEAALRHEVEEAQSPKAASGDAA